MVYFAVEGVRMENKWGGLGFWGFLGEGKKHLQGCPGKDLV